MAQAPGEHGFSFDLLSLFQDLLATASVDVGECQVAEARRVFAMEINPAYVDVAVERWQTETGKDAILDGDGRTFSEMKVERLGDKADAAA